MPLVQTRGAASAQGFGEFAQSGPVNYIEDVFSTYVYEGNGTTQQIVNGIDLSTKGGLIWTKSRSNAYSHALIDTVRGGRYVLQSNTVTAPGDQGSSVVNFNTNGYTWTSTGNSWNNNIAATNNYVGWTFREQPKFFDIVTYSGDSVSGRAIAHNLGSIPGFIIVKQLNSTGSWTCHHRSQPTNRVIRLESTAAQSAANSFPADATATDFTVNSFAEVNQTGSTYIAYLFAHNAGGFGLTGSDNVITCGSVVGTGNPTEITLGYEPQWLLIKNITSPQDWWIVDNMRGLIVENAADSKRLDANDADAETGLNVRPTATGFINGVMTVGETYIYIAVRRGPMKVPTTGTSVYDAQYAYSSPNTYRSTLTVDTAIQSSLSSAVDHQMYTRLTGTNYLVTNDAATQVSNASARFDTQTGFNTGVSTPPTYFAHLFRRAPSFHDVVCYTGTGVARTVAHNLTVAPQLIIAKGRTLGNNWAVSDPSTGNGFVNYLSLNSTNASGAFSGMWNDTAPTSTVFSLGDSGGVNANTYNYVAYLFATCAGVSKVGSYTGTGTTQTINCGFTAGSRFIMIKRTDSTGDWYVWDSERGIIAGNDPYLLLNTTAAQVTGTDYVDTAATGFEISSTAPAAINANGGTFIFLAIA